MNLKQLRHERGYSQQKLAQKLNVSRSTVAMWETGSSEPSLQMIQRIADVLSVSVAELFGEPADPSAHKGILIPVLGCVQAGLPNEAVEDVLDYEEITPELASTGEFFALRVRGDSMEPRMVDGDVVIVRKQDDADSGDVVVALVNGDEATIKRLKKRPEGILLIANNPTYEPMFFRIARFGSSPSASSARWSSSAQSSNFTKRKAGFDS